MSSVVSPAGDARRYGAKPAASAASRGARGRRHHSLCSAVLQRTALRGAMPTEHPQQQGVRSRSVCDVEMVGSAFSGFGSAALSRSGCAADRIAEARQAPRTFLLSCSTRWRSGLNFRNTGESSITTWLQRAGSEPARVVIWASETLADSSLITCPQRAGPRDGVPEGVPA